MKLKRSIHKLLIANRGEIARRIQAAAHARDIKTVVVYTKEEIHAGFVRHAHEAFCLQGQGGAAYLDQDDLIDKALAAGADAVHPGYGFLSENACFAQRVIDAGLTWVGPSPVVIKTMGDKKEARQCAQLLDVPVIPGQCFLKTKEGVFCAYEYAALLGYPVMLKDPFAGGGKAMRQVHSPQDFMHAWESVVAEAGKGVPAPDILVEKCILQGRHIEVQVAGDGKNAIHLFERECSLQRRNQKIIEEAPCLFISPDLKQKLFKAAVTLTRGMSYEGVGTLEFLVEDESFYFLEMNTRLQVEHSVTEMITGVDLVDLQLSIAQGEALPYRQEDIVLRGHAIEGRVYAEDPTRNFLPSSGTIIGLEIPSMPGIRIDHDLAQGTVITPFFDPMIAKVTAYGSSRDNTLARLQGALSELVIAGVITNITFLQALLCFPLVQEGKITTRLLYNQEILLQLCAIMATEQDRFLVAGLVAFEQRLESVEFLDQVREQDSLLKNVDQWRLQRWKLL